MKPWFREGAVADAPMGVIRTPNLRHRGLNDMLLSQAVAMASAVLVTFVTAHFLGPSGRGQVAFVTATGNLLGAAAFMSIHVGVTHAHKAGDTTALPRGLRVSMVSAVGVLLLTSAVAGVMFALHQPLAPQLALAAVASSLVCFNLGVLRTRQGLGDARVFRNTSIIQALIYVILATAAAVLAHSPHIVIYAWYVGMIISTAYALRGYPRDHLASLTPRQRYSTRSIITTSLSAHVGFTGIQALYRADVVVLGFIVGARDLGIYSIAAPIAELTWGFSEALSLVAFSQVRALQTPGERQMDRRKLIYINMVAGAIGAVLILVTAFVVLPRILPDYREATPLICILLPGVLVQGSSRIAFSALVATGVRRPAIIVGVVSAILSLLYIPFALMWGITGAAIASTVIYFLQAGVVFRIVNRSETHSGPESSPVDVKQ
jgi:O-antigen/teichoic acid export membrane protein